MFKTLRKLTEKLDKGAELLAYITDNKMLRRSLEEVDIKYNRLIAITRLLAEQVIRQDPRAKDIAEGVLNGEGDVKVTDIRVKDGVTIMMGHHWTTYTFGRAFAELLLKPDGSSWNNFETIFSDPLSGTRCTVTVQREGGKTLAEQRAALQEEVTQYKNNIAGIAALAHRLEVSVTVSPAIGPRSPEMMEVSKRALTLCDFINRSL